MVATVLRAKQSTACTTCSPFLRLSVPSIAALKMGLRSDGYPWMHLEMDGEGCSHKRHICVSWLVVRGRVRSGAKYIGYTVAFLGFTTGSV